MSENLSDPSALKCTSSGLVELARSWDKGNQMLLEAQEKRVAAAFLEEQRIHDLNEIVKKLKDQCLLANRALNIRLPGTKRLLYVGFRKGYAEPKVELLELDEV